MISTRKVVNPSLSAVGRILEGPGRRRSIASTLLCGEAFKVTICPPIPAERDPVSQSLLPTDPQPTGRSRGDRRVALGLRMVLLSLPLLLAACGGYSSSTSSTSTTSGAGAGVTSTTAGGSSTTACTIPQNNGGDHDADNNGGPSDGDGCNR